MENDKKAIAIDNNKKSQAFPHNYSSDLPGLTKREFFFAQATNGFVAKHGCVDFTEQDAKRMANMVDLIMKEL